MVFGEKLVEQPLPVGLECGIFAVAVAERDVIVVELEEEEAVEEPVFRAVGISMGDVGSKVFFCPCRAVGVAGIDQSEV